MQGICAVALLRVAPYHALRTVAPTELSAHEFSWESAFDSITGYMTPVLRLAHQVRDPRSCLSRSFPRSGWFLKSAASQTSFPHPTIVAGDYISGLKYVCTNQCVLICGNMFCHCSQKLTHHRAFLC